MKISIILPILNEEIVIQACLTQLQPFIPTCEIILVDGGSSDNTLALIGAVADRVFFSKKGRARQMNAGVEYATGDVLLFLHVDTCLPENAPQLIEEAISSGRHWGRFAIRFSGRHPMFWLIAQMMNLRSALTGIATGDQAIFVTRQAFNAVGKYPEISLMEDIALSTALKRIGPPLCLNAKVTSSSRRWEVNGIYSTIVLMWTLRLLYFFGVAPETLASLYNRGKLWKR
ncbi:MAG: glycosyltransferase family 2 protein [Methylococcaceae bacterium]|nr:glycosyltransferase family 2 protein [Methylococcaceae bacterium]